MKRLAILVCALTTILCACSATEAPIEKKPETPPEETTPGEVEEPYKGGFTKEQRISDANTIIAIFEREYAPRQWKEEYLGISFQQMSVDLLSAAARDMDDIQFYELIGKYLAGFKDSHVHHFFPTTAVAALPIDFDDIDGHAIVTDFDEEKVQGISIGDEVVEFDGKPIDEAREELIPYLGQGNQRKLSRLATFYLTYLSQDTFPYLPEGDKVAIGLKSADGEEKRIEVGWIRKGHELAEFNDEGIDIATSAAAMKMKKPHDNPLNALRNRMDPAALIQRASIFKRTKPFFITGDNFIERKAKPYYSGVFVTGDKKIGYLRIHSFSSTDVNFEEAFAQLEDDIQYFEEATDALIIDETANPGGDWCYTLKVASMFFARPFKETNDRWRANRSILNMLEGAAENKKIDDNDRKIAANIAEGIRKALKEGRLLTEPFPVCDYDGTIEPYQNSNGNSISYSKPVMILINELSNSCGDYFPALMQDEKRATLFGAQTSGAGGSVTFMSDPVGYSEIMFSYTISLGWREPVVTTPDGVETHYIENVGAIPDIEYLITLDDFMSGYTLYRNAMVQAALGLIDNAGAREVEDEK